MKKMEIKFKIDYNKYDEYIFNTEDIITLQVKRPFNIHIIEQNKRDYKVIKIVFLTIKNNNIIKHNIEKKIDRNKREIIDYLREKINKKFKKVLKDEIKFSAKDISNLTNKELSYFSYVLPLPLIYPDIILPIDSYYLGFWLGDGHSSNPGIFTCGGETKIEYNSDQKIILPWMKDFAKNLGLVLVPVKEDRKLTFAINDGKGRTGKIQSDNYCFKEDWIKDVYNSCKKLEENKIINIFINNYIEKYKENNEYFCNNDIVKITVLILAKEEGNNEWLKFENIIEASKNTPCAESTIYRSIREKIYINKWMYKKIELKETRKCEYNTKNYIKRINKNETESKQSEFKIHLKNIP